MASAAAELVAEREPGPMLDDSNRTFVGAGGLVRMALDQYTEILAKASDPRVSNWPLMDSPIPTFVIVVLYLYGVTLLGPRLMSNKKAFNLRSTLVAYNAFQVIFSLGMMYEVQYKMLNFYFQFVVAFLTPNSNSAWSRYNLTVCYPVNKLFKQVF